MVISLNKLDVYVQVYVDNIKLLSDTEYLRYTFCYNINDNKLETIFFSLDIKQEKTNSRRCISFSEYKSLSNLSQIFNNFI